MSETTLSLAKKALSTPNGAKRALSLLEEQVCRNEAIEQDSTIWACIAHLRKKVGDLEGAEAANLRARALVDVVPKKLVFEDDVKEVAGRCGELLGEIVGDGVVETGGVDEMGKVQRLVARSRRLREISEVLLRGMMEDDM